MALGHNDKYERGEEVRRKMRGGKEKVGRKEFAAFLLKKKKFGPNFVML
jgi:hypothetical protein